MPADLNLSRERIVALVVEMRGYFDGTLIRDTGSITATTAEIHDVLMRALSEPTRLAAARQEGRQEGYREGVEAAARWHDDQATDLERRVEMREGQFISGMDRVARVHRCDAAAIRALSPPPAEPSAPVTPDERRALNAEVQDYMIACGQHAESRRVAEARITALEAENAALREVTAAVAKAVEGLSLGEGEDDRLDWSVILKIGDLRRARALLQGQGGGDAEAV